MLYEQQMRRGWDGAWECGVRVAGDTWHWATMSGVRRKDIAAKRAPEAIAGLLRERAKAIREAAWAEIARADSLTSAADSLVSKKASE